MMWYRKLRRYDRRHPGGDCGCGCIICTGQGTHCAANDCNRRLPHLTKFEQAILRQLK